MRCTGRDDEDFADAVVARLVELVERGRLEARGDLSNWRFSEVRLPRSAQPCRADGRNGRKREKRPALR